MSTLNDAIATWKQSKDYSQAKQQKLDQYKKDHDARQKKTQGDINTFTNILSGKTAATGALTDGSTATGTHEATLDTTITFPAIMNQHDSTSSFGPSAPSWFTNIGGFAGGVVIFNMYNYYANKYAVSGTPWTTRYDWSPTVKDWTTPKIYLAWAYAVLHSKQLDTFFTNAILATNDSSVVSQLTAAKAVMLQQRKSVESSYNAITTKLNDAKNQLKQIDADYVSQVQALIGLKSSGTSSSGTVPPKPLPTTSTDIFPSLYTLPQDVEFNLSPHKYSLPISADIVNGRPGSGAGVEYDNNLRRGRFYFYQDSTATFTQSATTANDPGRTASNGSKQKYGFQFLWNPTSWSTSVQINEGAVPSSSQYWSSSLPVFPSGQQLDLSIILDRTNDFGSFGPLLSDKQATLEQIAARDISLSLTGGDKDSRAEAQAAISTANKALPSVYADFASQMREFYVYTGNKYEEKIKDLALRGTLADLEYLYKTVNGDGWQRLGVATSDIGFLMMNLVVIELGPSRYLGYLNSLNIQHTNFTPNMVPITSQVGLSFVLMASAKIAQNYTQVSAGNGANTTGR